MPFRHTSDSRAIPCKFAHKRHPSRLEKRRVCTQHKLFTSEVSKEHTLKVYVVFFSF